MHPRRNRAASADPRDRGLFADRLANDKKVLGRVNKMGANLFPPGCDTFKDFERKWSEARGKAAGPLASDADRANWATWTVEAARVLGFASFLKLRANLNTTLVVLVLLFVVATACLAWLGYTLAKQRPGTVAEHAAAFDPQGWERLARELEATCGTGPFAASTVGEPAFAGWWTIRLVAPDRCAGAELTVPEGFVTIAAKPE
jgi:hypothetical protein